MTKVDIISGFLGAGKTTFIKKLISDVYPGEQIVLIENEFGEIGIDGTFMNNAGIEVTEINSGCICCSLVGDFEASLKEVLETYHPDRIIIEPSGVGKLSDVIKAVSDVHSHELELDNYIAVIDAKKCRLYTKNFGEFFNNQIEYASLIILSRTQDITEFQLDECLKIIKEHNNQANVITTPWDQLTKEILINAFSNSDNLRDELLEQLDICPICAHHHDHHHDHEHHHNHEHHHDHNCECGHEHHHADEVFTSWGKQTPKKYSKSQLEKILKEGLENRFKRHENMAKIVRNWAEEHFEIFTDKNHLSNTLTVVKNTQNIDVSKLNEELQKRGYLIANGYGELKDKTFRISHMGDYTEEDIRDLLRNIDEILGFCPEVISF